MPKSNDIHFAQPNIQPSQPLLSATNFDQQQQQQQQRHQAAQQLESSVAYETLSGANSNFASSNYARANQFQQQQQQDSNESSGTSRTMLNTDSKALILALPIMMSQSFAGYEPGKFVLLLSVNIIIIII